MLRRLAWTGVVAILIVTPALAGGRGRTRTGPVVSPFGVLYDTRSPEWRASGGNPIMLQQLLEQKMLRQQQEMYLRQQQQAAKSQAAAKKGSASKGLESNVNSAPGFTNDPSRLPVLNRDSRKKKRRPTLQPSTTSTDTRAKSADGSASGKNPTVMPDPLKSPTSSPGPAKPR